MSPTSNSDNVVIIGLSGPSSSGKTTLARLLRQVFNVSVAGSSSTSTSTTSSAGPGVRTNGAGRTPTETAAEAAISSSPSRKSSIRLFILHEDDFYKTDKLIPRKEFTSKAHGTRTLEDWDCIEAIDLPLLSSTLAHIKQYGVLPPDTVSKEDQNTVGASGVPESTVEELKADVMSWVSSLLQRRRRRENQNSNGRAPAGDEDDNESETAITICVLDGFLLYPSPDSAIGTEEREMLDMMNTSLDAKLFIPSTRAHTIDRRTKRTGYVTLEGFWEDPPGYVEDVVWANYRKEYGWLFGGVEGDVETKNERSEDEDAEKWRVVDEGKVDREVAEANGISVSPGTGDVQLRDILPWAIDRLKQTVERKVA